MWAFELGNVPYIWVFLPFPWVPINSRAGDIRLLLQQLLPIRTLDRSPPHMAVRIEGLGYDEDETIASSEVTSADNDAGKYKTRTFRQHEDHRATHYDGL